MRVCRSDNNANKNSTQNYIDTFVSHIVREISHTTLFYGVTSHTTKVLSFFKEGLIKVWLQNHTWHTYLLQ